MAEALTMGLDVGTLLVLLAFFWRFGAGIRTESGPGTDHLQEALAKLDLLTLNHDERLEKIEMRFDTLKRTVLEDKDAADKQWRKVRATQRRAEEREEEDEGGEFPGFDAPGGNGQGMLPMYPNVVPDEEIRRAARSAVAIRRRK